MAGLAVMLLAAVLPLHTAQNNFERVKPHCNISTYGHVNHDSGGFDFRAKLQVFLNGEANGFLEFAFADGTVRTYRALAGLVDRSEDARRPKLLILLDYSNPAAANANSSRDFLMATVQRDATEPGRDIWDLAGSTMGGSGSEDPCLPPFSIVPGKLDFPNLTFYVPESIEYVPGKGRGDPYMPELGLHYPCQRVQPDGLAAEIGFHAQVVLNQSHRARGGVELATRGGGAPLRLDALLGLPIPDSVPLVSLRPALVLFIVAGAPLELDNLVLATVSPDARKVGCDLWDLTGTDLVGDPSSNCHLRFDGVGTGALERPGPRR